LFAAPVGLIGLVLATVIMLVLANPALPVLFVGVVTEATVVFATGTRLRTALEVLNLPLLLGLFLLALAIAVVAREWHFPSNLMASSGIWATASIGALGANIMNNLPAAALLSANLGPNLTVLGAMSSLLWLRIARQNGATPSIALFSAVGVVVVVTTMAASLIVSGG
jgi:hypothetical protein